MARGGFAQRARQELMVEAQIAGRGVRDPAVLEAMTSIPREDFVDPALRDYAAEDAALVLAPGVLLPQPYLIARMLEGLGADHQRVGLIGDQTGYVAALLGRIAGSVGWLVSGSGREDAALRAIARIGISNVEIGAWEPNVAGRYERVLLVEAAAEEVRRRLGSLAVGGRLIAAVPTGSAEREVVAIHQPVADAYDRRSLGTVRFAILPYGSAEPAPLRLAFRPIGRRGADSAPLVVREAAEPFDSLEGIELAPLLDRIPDDTRLVLIGEATHGTSEFYRIRARITRELIERRGFRLVAIEADWPDAAVVHRHVIGRPPAEGQPRPFTRFPTWMWRNREVADFVAWLRAWNEAIRPPESRVGFHGLDLYSLHASLGAVLGYLERTDPEVALLARERYGCLRPLDLSPAQYGRFALTGRYRSCEEPVVRMLADLLRRRSELAARDGAEFFDAEQNARLIANAERYYRVMYYGAVESWNLRDRHMFETLERLLRDDTARGVVWAHNSHLGDARATELGAQGELNLGRLCRAAYGARAYLIGFGTDRGTVAAASDWDRPMQRMSVRPADPASYEAVCRDTQVPAFFLPLRYPRRPELRAELGLPRLERAIGVVYRPETELESHYFGAILPDQFDEYVWVAETEAVRPLSGPEGGGPAETYPFGL